MALDFIFQIFEIPREVLVSILGGIIPSQFLNPLFPIPYAKEISLGIVLLFALISIFAGFRWVIRLVGISFVIVGFLEGLSGGITAVVIILGIALVVKLIRKFKGSGEGFGKGMGKEEKMDFGNEKIGGGEEEFKMPEEKGEEFNMPEEKTPINPTQPPAQQPQVQQKVCPYCGTPLQYVPQYQRYYCPRCRRYI